MMDLESILQQIVPQDDLHAKWLNTLSMMENVGARKISASEHPQKVDLIVLKHAAEEARHAYYLKSQIQKVASDRCPTYESRYLLAPLQSYHYLHSLDLEISRYLKKELKLEGYSLRYAAYLLVTYAIEVRADELYPVYQKVLQEHQSKVNVRFIILEEEGHLEEMTQQLKDFSEEWEEYAKIVCAIEEKLFQTWVQEVGRAIDLVQV